MHLLVRLVRALWVFGIIFASYMVQLGLLKAFRRWELSEETGREVARMPGWLERRSSVVDQKNARRLLRGMLRLRGVYIKLGQVLSIMGGFLPPVYGKELESLQDAVPPRPFGEMRDAFVESLGRAPEECFARIEEEPVAAASLGQVHLAHTHEGEKVAVKVLYPGIRGIIRTDMRVVKLALRVYRAFVPVQNLDSVHSALVDLLRRETDYRHEAACMERMAENFVNEDDILFPAVLHDVSSGTVLTMTFMEGFKITDVERMEAEGISRHQVATRLVECFYKMLFVDQYFHADPHPGNFLVRKSEETGDPEIVILDFGAVSEVDRKTVDGMIDVLRSFFEGDDSLVMRGIEQIGFVAEGGDRELLERTTKRYFEKLLQIEDRTAGALMRANQRELEALADPEVQRQELRRLMQSVHYPDGWFYVERAAVLMFWLCGQIDPELDTLQVGMPYVLPLLQERLVAQ